ncbi:MAG: protein kinase [Nannocystis sp.]|nr:serine/threonine-protein kinase [Nannocystis sp.]MBA3545989.1 protein kinase [Nannocystis sp.]
MQVTGPTGRPPGVDVAPALDETLAPGLTLTADQGSCRPEPTTHRHGPVLPLPPVSGLEQTAIGSGVVDPSLGGSGRFAALLNHEREPGRIGRFVVLRRLGAGGMGVVYAAYDEELDRKLAIKVVREDTQGAQGRTRMQREAQAMARLSHPNVVQIYEAGEFAGQVYVAMEFIKGQNLSEWLAAEERSPEETLEVFLQAGRGLAAAHRQGLVHRDFKPDNVLVDGDGRARVLDFGLARAEVGHQDDAADSVIARIGGVQGNVLSTELTMAGTILGTPAFMSPEQHLGTPTDARSDQFSFCVALYGALYHRAAFSGHTLIELTENVTGGKLRKPPGDTKVPASVFAALAVGLATDPNERYPSMDTLLGELAPDVPDGRRRWAWPAALVGVAGLAVLLTLVMVGDPAPAPEDLQTIERLSAEARQAAARLRWIYPRSDDLRDTAYNRVVQLEGISGPAQPRALATAEGLRAEFAEALVVLGDRYFDDPDAQAFARDYYVQALVFMPGQPRARERAAVTLGELSDLRVRAGEGDFSSVQLDAVEPLRILAEPDVVLAGALATAYTEQNDEHLSASGQAKLEKVLRRSGLLTADPAAPRGSDPVAPATGPVSPTPPTPTPSTPTPSIPTEVAVDPILAPPGAGEATTPGKPGKPGKSGKPIEDTKAARDPSKPDKSVPAAEDDPDAAVVDPERSRALTAEAEAAWRRGDGAAAEKLYNQALDLWNRNGAALMGLSDISFERGSFERAVKYAEKAVRAEPARADYLLRLGDAYFKVFRYSDAQLRYERAAELGHPKADERLARVRAKVGE